MIGEKFPGHDDAFRMPISHCPHCGYKINAASVANSTKPVMPRPGDFSLCLKCAAILRFKDDLTLRATTLGEHDEAGPELQRAVNAILECKKMDPNWCVRRSS